MSKHINLESSHPICTPTEKIPTSPTSSPLGRCSRLNIQMRRARRKVSSSGAAKAKIRAQTQAIWSSSLATASTWPCRSTAKRKKRSGSATQTNK